MQIHYQRWFKLFLFSFGISIACTFILEWLSSDFWFNNEKFSILGLELFYPKRKVVDILSHIDLSAKLALNYQLIFDFVFMAGIYPAIASLCMMAREKQIATGIRNFLFAMAILQPVAWAFDVSENIYLLGWLDNPEIGDEFGTYHNIVAAKWIIAIVGTLSGIFFLLLVRTSQGNPKSAPDSYRD